MRSLFIAGLLLTAPLFNATLLASPFEPAFSFAENQAQHRRLPAHDIWWTVNGRDMAWNFRNLHQLFPTVNVYRNGPIRPLPQRPDRRLADFSVDTGSGEMRFADFIQSDLSSTLGVIILHRGDVVFEAYPRMQPYEMPIYWSVAKVFSGLLVRILEERGDIDVSHTIDHYLPALKNSDLAGTTVRNFLDMATGLDCADDYENKSSCYYKFSVTLGDGFWQPGDSKNPYTYLAGLKANRLHPQGQHFSYSGLNTFVLSWLVEQTTGLSFQDALTREVWWHIGAEANASFIAPYNGVALTSGGFVSRLRDLARFGLIYTPAHKGKSIISAAHIDLLLNQGRPELLANAGYQQPNVRHNVYQWDSVLRNDTLYKGGWAGQGLIVNPRLDLVIAYAGHFKQDQSEQPLRPVLLRMLEAIYDN